MAVVYNILSKKQLHLLSFRVTDPRHAAGEVYARNRAAVTQTDALGVGIGVGVGIDTDSDPDPDSEAGPGMYTQETGECVS